jgi:hypothetical protein
MIPHAKQFLWKRWEAFSQTPFGCLLRLFVGRMFHGGAEPGAEELDIGVGVIIILLAMPGVFVSLLMFEKYGSLIRFLRGDKVFDPFTATIPDEYFFIVLSMVVTGGAALWRWDTIFLDRRDYMNLVPLPISLSSLFFANLCAILVLTGIFTLVVNAASLVFFPVAVLGGSQGSFSLFFRFAAGHTVAVFLASIFSCFAVFALAGLLMALLPAAVFRRISLFARFLAAIWLLALLGSSVAVPDLLSKMSIANAHRVALLPPVSFLGLSRTVWGRGGDPFVASMTRAAVLVLGLAFFTAILTYVGSFRRSFIRIPEAPDAGPLPRMPFSLSLLGLVHKGILRTPSQRACYHFVARTLLRSDGHLQVVLGFLALGLVAAADALTSAPDPRSIVTGKTPSLEFLSVPFILSYCMVIGIRFAFEIPADLRANWIFRLWLDRDRHEARAIARRVLLMFSLSWLAPACFLVTLALWGWITALLHMAILTLCTVVLIQVLLIRFRKIPFTCSYPPFKSYSGIILVAYLIGFVVFTDYVPRMECWSLFDPWMVVWFVPLLLIVVGALHFYRKQMLDMDKELIFEDVSVSGF